VAAREEAVQLCRKYSENGDNANLKDFAKAVLPTLEGHPQQVSDLRRASWFEQLRISATSGACVGLPGKPFFA
jgi:Domain of unknown function (DUF4142)